MIICNMCQKLPTDYRYVTICPECVEKIDNIIPKTKAEEQLIKKALTLHKFLHEHDGPTSWTFEFYKAADKVIEERKKKK